MADYQLGVIGAGNMAEAILRGVIGGNLLPHKAVVAADPSLERRKAMINGVGVTCVDDNGVAAACPRVLLAVKPQMMADVLAGIAPAVGDDALIISVAAGITTALIDEKLGRRGRIVRVMPNTPMLVGAGMTALAAGPRAGSAELDWAEKLFAGSGKAVRVDESLMDAVTAVSGSGPAYFFYLVEAMIAAGIAEGLDAETAKTLAVQTCVGAAKMLAESGESPGVLRARVTSPNGTTQRAIEMMDATGVAGSLVKAVRAAADRSRELGK